MVTFSLPADDDVAEAANGTPKPRPSLPFAKRSLASSFAVKRNDTPYKASSRRLFGNQRDEALPAGLSSSSIATARNIFSATTFADSPSSTTFSPSLPQSAMKRLFAPGSTPEPNRLVRAQATPRGMAATASDKELFPMRIASPPAELSGEALAQKVPREWNSKGSIYSDQFLGHLCPAELDDEQRRQFFCILDLRRLKYAANEIFSRKDWKLNVINFAKEFEKSRSIILLRYGLYEFQTIKPSKAILQKWRREHGLPESDEEEVDGTPSRFASLKKRKASDDFAKDSAASVKGKRRAMDVDEPAPETPAAASSKNKRKASMSEESPAKMQKPAPSSAKALFEKIANKAATAAQSPAATAPGNLFSMAKPSSTGGGGSSSSNLARSVLTSGPSQRGPDTQAGSNIFGYLSDASSAKNSGVEADAESESETGSDETAKQRHKDKPTLPAAIAAGDAGAGVPVNNPFSSLGGGNTAVGNSSVPGTRESTPGRSLFDRITKSSDGHPVRTESEAEAEVDKPQTTTTTTTTLKPASPLDQTWNPNTTPMKFAPAATQSSSLFGNTPSTATNNNNNNNNNNIFAPKTAASSANLGTAAQHAPSAKEPVFGAGAEQGAGQDGGESDKENGSKRSKKTVSDAKPATATPSATLFGEKTAAAQEKPADAEPPKATSLFGGQAAPSIFASTSTTGTTSSSLFGANKPEAATSDSSASAAPASSGFLFGTPSTDGAGAGAKTATAPATAEPAASQPASFSFGAPSSQVDKAKSGFATEAAASNTAPFASGNKFSSSGTAPVGGSLFGGSPMKQDELSPAKNLFGGATTSMFSFGAKPQGATDSAPAFGNPSTNGSADHNVPFGAGTSSNTGGFSFNFAGGAPSSGSSFVNPFAAQSSSSSDPAPKATGGGLFNFDSSSSGPSNPFQFGSGGGANGSSSGGSIFGQLGGVSGPGGTSSNLSGGQSQVSSQASGAVFGSSQPAPAFGGVQPPAGGSSTTGTNSPLNFGGGGGGGGGGSSLATTPAVGTPEHWSQAEATTSGGEPKEGEDEAQISLADAVDADEVVLHEVRAKALKFSSPRENKSDSEDGKKAKAKSPWTTRGVGPLRLLKHRETGAVRLLLRTEPSGNVAVNRTVLPNVVYKADGKYVKVTTSTAEGHGLETWMMQVKTEEAAKELVVALEKNKGANGE